ncbi:MAG: hypothetical protein WCA20_34865 [Candidatus Sulfotelmatobacter sp.]
MPVLKVFDWLGLGRKEEPREDVFLPAFFICPIRKTPDAETKRRSSTFFRAANYSLLVLVRKSIPALEHLLDSPDWL